MNRLCLLVPALGLPFLVALLAFPASAGAQESAGYRALWPVPQPALTREEADPISDLLARDEAAPQDADADALLIAPSAMGHAQRARAAVARQRVVPLAIIREGLVPGGPVSTALPERAVGLRLGADTLAVSTRLVAPAGSDRGANARLDWQLGRPVAASETGFIWTVTTGGTGGMAVSPEQNANLLMGFRQPIFAHLTLTSQLTLQGNYVFAAGNGAHSAVVPEVLLSTALNALVDLPFEASFDLGLARQMPLLASQYETRGSAMLRVRYALD